MNKEPTIQEIQSRIINLPGRPPAMLDRDLAEIYGTETKRVNEAAKRNPERFPHDFRFQLTKEEIETLRSQNATFQWLQGVKYLPWVYTREGCNMMSACLETPIAINRSVFIMRAFSAIEAEAIRRYQADSESPGRITGERFDMSVKRFKVALEAVKLMGISDKTEARRIANEITKETTGVDLMGFILPFCSPDAVQKVVAVPPPADYDEEDETLNSFVNAWWEAHKANAVPSRLLYQLITDKKISMNLGTGSKRSQKVRLSKKLSKLDGQQVGRYRIIAAGKCKGVLTWKLEKIK